MLRFRAITKPKMSIVLIGGAGGNRTRVRNAFPLASYNNISSVLPMTPLVKLPLYDQPILNILRRIRM